MPADAGSAAPLPIRPRVRQREKCECVDGTLETATGRKNSRAAVEQRSVTPQQRRVPGEQPRHRANRKKWSANE